MDVLELIRDPQGQPIGTLATFVAFRDWTPAEMAALRGLGTLERYRAGDVVIDRGADDDRALFIVVAGELEVHRGGERRDVLQPGDLVGELAFVDGQPRTAVVRTRTDAAALRIRPADLDRLAERDAPIALKFMREIARILSFRLRTAWA